VQKREENEDVSPNNEKLRDAYSFISKSLKKDYDISNLIVIGTIKVDEHSRLPFSKKIKEVLPIFPGDILGVYQNIINNTIIFKVQRHKDISDTWIIKRQNYDATESPLTNKNTNWISKNNKNIITNEQYYAETNLTSTKSNFNIMIIDDIEEILDFYKDILEYSIDNNDEKKYVIETFSSSVEALNRFVNVHTNNEAFSFRFDLIIIDIKMPKISGLQLYQMLKIIDLNVKVLFISALDTTEELAGILPGINSADIIKKPFSSDLFISKVNEKINLI